MSFALKAVVFILVIAVIGGFVINNFPALKQRIIEAINPAAKEGRLLGELKTNLDDIGNAMAGLNPKNQKDAEIKLEKSKELLNKSKNLLGNISDINLKNSGLISQGVSKIIDAFTDRTPYPADHIPLGSSLPNSPSQIVCPPTN